MSSLQDPEVQCPSCRAMNVWFAEFCTSCGTSLSGATLQGGDAPTGQGEGVQSGNTQVPCPSCRVMNGLVDRFCTSCGTSLAGVTLQGGDSPTFQGEGLRSVDTQTAASAPSQNTILCTSCGTAVDASARFCERCGTPVGPSVAPQRSQGGFSCPYCSSDMSPIMKKKFTVVTWVVLIALLLIDFLLAPFAFFISEQRRVCAACGNSLG